ncbi:MAG TPA: bestrophin family ion channel [Chitinophagaceae bacterium]|jgi:putative membrane protein|nr:bestrophin family ion channel [Chitinophagaceae bacterium]
MIQYNPKEWFTFIFRFHKSDTLRKLFPLMIGIAIYCALIVYLEREYFKLPPDSYVKNIPMMHVLLGGAISLLLVFRTNSAYDRWWEGRKLWGDLTNNSRNLAIKLNALLTHDDKTNRDFFRKLIPAYAFALKNHLLSHKADWELFDKHVDEQIQSKINKEKHIPNQVAEMLMHKIMQLNKEGKLSEMHLLMLNEEIRSFTNICGACERIKNTPIPYSYSVFIKKFIFGYIMTLPFGYMFSLGYLSIPIVLFIFYVLASLEIIAEEIEDPFGADTNDLPLEKMALNIHHNLDDILRKI